MSILGYFKDRFIYLLVNFIVFMIIGMLMKVTEMGSSVIFIVFCIWFLPMIIYMILEFLQKKRYYNELISIIENLDKKYLISEVISNPHFEEGKIVNEILREANRDMQENVKFYKNRQSEYREYIEAWVHEIKTPIASSLLIVENNEDVMPIAMKEQIKKTEYFVDQVLYYSRSNNVEKDYIIKKFDLGSSVRNVIKKNANDMISKKIAIDLEGIDVEVYSDAKWIEFILNQIISNCIKYSRKDGARVKIVGYENKNNVILSISDNGALISEKDIGRVFEKGFTGENGRKFGKSTGMGLYICKRLCDKLGIGISISSEEKTEVKLIFPRSIR